MIDPIEILALLTMPTIFVLILYETLKRIWDIFSYRTILYEERLPEVYTIADIGAPIHKGIACHLWEYLE